MSPEKRKQRLINISKKNVSYLLHKGVIWFNRTFLPDVLEAEKAKEIDKSILSDIWYLIGDAYDMNDAPMKALKSYKKAISLDKTNSVAYREAALILEEIGKYDLSLKYIDKALEIKPDDDYSIGDKESIIANIAQNTTPLYEKGDIIWMMNEKLADKAYQLVIDKLINTIDADQLKILAKAYGGLNKAREYLEIWNKISHLAVNIEIGYDDWFYMPVRVFNSDSIWRIFKKMNNNIKPSIFIHFDSLDEEYKNLFIEEYRNLVCDFYISKATGDIENISKMKERFPKWKELNYAR